MDFGDILIKCTRPVVTIICMGTLAQVITQQIEMPAWAISLLSGVVLWWFTTRTIEKVKDAKKTD